MRFNRMVMALGLSVLALAVVGCQPATPSSEPPDDTAVPAVTEAVSAELPTLTVAPPEDSAVESPTDTPAAEPVPPTEVPTTDAAAEDAASAPSRSVTFDQLGITLEVPAELLVIKEPMVNLDDPSRLESYLFYIQNYGFPGGPSSGDFQMYGHLQYSLPPITWEELAAGQLDSEMNAYAEEIEINGLRGFDTQLTGVRNRYVFHFFLDGRVLSVAVSQPTEENKAIADEIMSTIQFDASTIPDASGVQLVVEPAGYYQMYVPDDWTTSFSEPVGIRLSDLQASSADASVLVEETEGPHSNISYQSGVVMSMVVLEDNSATMEPTAALIRSSQPIMIGGIEGNDYTFVEPSTVEGELRELRFFHNGLSYLLRFGYATDADLDGIDWIIRNLQIRP